MAGSTAVFTFQDPFQEIPSIDPSSFFVRNTTLAPSGTTLNEEQNPLNFENDLAGEEWANLLDSEDLLTDPSMWEFCHGNDDQTGNSPVGTSGFLEEGCSNHGFYDSRDEKPGGHPMPLPVFPVPASQYNCVCCQRLREITHTNGMYIKRLEIHGVFGVITHAVLGIYDYKSSFQTQDLQLFDFHKESAQTVKKFLVQYFEACKQEGYSLIQDPLSAFYEALSVGLNESYDPNDFQQSPENSGDCRYNNQRETWMQPDGRSNHGGSMKIPLSMQRERTRQLKLKDFIEFFDLPIEKAAQKLNLCPTVMKKICRRYGVPRWPYRKIKSIERKLSKLINIVNTSDNEERARAQEDIRKHQQELASIYEPFTK